MANVLTMKSCPKSVKSVTFERIRKVLRDTPTGNPNIVVQSTIKEVQQKWKSTGRRECLANPFVCIN